MYVESLYVCKFYLASALQRRVRKPSSDNIPSTQNYFQTNCWIVIPMLGKYNENTTLGKFVWA